MIDIAINQTHCPGCGRRIVTCEACGKVFHSPRTEAETIAESRRMWSEDQLKQGTITVCDDCFRARMKELTRQGLVA